MKKLQNNPAFPVGQGSDRTASSFSFQRAPNCDADNLNEMEWREMTAEGGLNVIPTDRPELERITGQHIETLSV